MPSPNSSQNKMHWQAAAFAHFESSMEVAVELEQRLSDDPQDVVARAGLLGYYCGHRTKSNADVKKRIGHILWVLEFAPDCGLGRTPLMDFPESGNLVACRRKKELLVQQCEIFKDNVGVLTDLAGAFHLNDSELALKYLRRAYKIATAKEKRDVAFWLAHRLHNVGLVDNDFSKLNEAVVFMQEVVDAQVSKVRNDFRFKLAQMALDSKQVDLAIHICNQMLAAVEQDDQNIHVAHNILGRIAFQNGNTQLAKKHLLLSAKVKGSPRLGSYGPHMNLAQDLLQSGEREAVLQYLKDCKKFWEMGKRKLPNWIKAIEQNRLPRLKGDD
jgi:hypothetical protein